MHAYAPYRAQNDRGGEEVLLDVDALSAGRDSYSLVRHHHS